MRLAGRDDVFFWSAAKTRQTRFHPVWLISYLQGFDIFYEKTLL
jgi:hypothetical protein